MSNNVTMTFSIIKICVRGHSVSRYVGLVINFQRGVAEYTDLSKLFLLWSSRFISSAFSQCPFLHWALHTSVHPMDARTYIQYIYTLYSMYMYSIHVYAIALLVALLWHLFSPPAPLLLCWGCRCWGWHCLCCNSCYRWYSGQRYTCTRGSGRCVACYIKRLTDVSLSPQSSVDELHGLSEVSQYVCSQCSSWPVHWPCRMVEPRKAGRMKVKRKMMYVYLHLCVSV